MLFENITIPEADFSAVRKNQYVGVRDGKIAYIGTEAPEGEWDGRFDGRHALLMPGFVNAHSHAPMVLLRGYAENLPLQRWLNEKVFPFEDCMTDQSMYAGTMLAAAEMLRFGVCSFTDMYMRIPAMARGVLDSGMKCNLCRGLTVFDGSDYASLSNYSDNIMFLKELDGAGDGRLKIDFCIHGEYTSNPDAVAGVARHAEETGVRVHVHVSETRGEVEDCKKRHGKTPVQYFYDLGLFNQPTTAAHCVWLEDGDFDLLKEKQVTVAACPVSNMKLASGFADIPRMLEMGINVALGTDGAASNNNLNLMKDLFLFATLYKGCSGDPTVVTPAQALSAATVSGWRSQGRENCGILRVGAPADLTVLDIDTPWMVPETDLISNLVFAAQGSDVRLTMVDGKVLYKDGEYPCMDIEKIKHMVRSETSRILGVLK